MTESALAAVRGLLPAIAESAADVDRNRAVDPGIIAALQDAGFFSMLQPTSFGGLEVEPDDYLAATREISAACMSTGWLAGMLGVSTWHLALFDKRAQHDVWDSDRRALVCASYAPTGRLERVNGGFRLSGHWSHCTGVDHAAWLMAGALVVGDDGAAQDFVVALVPRHDYAIEPNWNGLGLRGIGAHDVVVAGATVPGHRTFGWVTPDQRSRLAPLYRLPQPILYTHTGTAPVLGAALGVLAARRAKVRHPLSAVAMAEADLELSVLQMRRNVAELMACARLDAGPEEELMLRSRRDQVLAFERAMTAIRLFEPDVDAELVERVWRDVRTAHMHVANDVERVLSVVGQFAFGLKVDAFIL
ncbi:acyl-CoA dehydrogenase family protein [Mycobacterium kyorinense]|uniref:Acyl-CoA dehydrogenase n=1 Tax=Mycobacterium kyorinense TaxID=487514 RepID=A0A1X1XZZ3_9MYCO|nr:acyl-CoA dehydrogenase family protein [Mycobacterium kyorinense]ORW04453.1 acyl-CoA dehydrogenase [Mycobacterium kyorinense]